MNGHYKLIAVVAFVLILFSCQKEDVKIYGDEAYLFFDMPTYGLSNTPRDSIVFSFPAKGDECQVDTLWFKARIIGTPVSYEREIAFAVNKEKTTARENENYKILTSVIPANGFSADIPLVVFREGLKDKSVRLELTIQPNEYFGAGFERYSKAIFLWGDMYIKPDNWETSNYKNCFGTFTETRYAFILKTCHLLELPDPQDLVTLGFYNAKVREALYEYNNTPGNVPLEDELGVVQFPVWSGSGGLG